MQYKYSKLYNFLGRNATMGTVGSVKKHLFAN